MYSIRDVSLSRNKPGRDAGHFVNSGTVPGNPRHPIARFPGIPKWEKPVALVRN